MSETSATPTTATTPTTTTAPAGATAPATAPAAAETAPPKVKVRAPRQRACDEKDAKGKLCCGHLKRYYDYPKEVEALVGGPKMEIYRCEFCKTFYKPNLAEMSQSFTLRT
jgi:hypothetical protein